MQYDIRLKVIGAVTLGREGVEASLGRGGVEAALYVKGLKLRWGLGL